MIAAAVVISLLYFFIMLFLLYGFFQVKNASEVNQPPKTTFSIVVPYRNEAENLPLLFTSLLKLKYPLEKFEILLVNDASEDHSEALCRDFQKENPGLNIQLLQNARRSNSPKKDAIQTAVEAARFEFILTTDADCLVPEGWLEQFNSVIQKEEAVAIAGPVGFNKGVPKMSFLERFQETEMLSLQAATIGGFGAKLPFMCNGANFCYSKTAFLEVEGFTGNYGIASGDDIFLLEKFQKSGMAITFLKSDAAVVFTQPADDLSSLFSQRVRWAAKTSAYGNIFGKFVGLVVFLMNLALVAAAVAVIADLFSYKILAVMFLLKFNVDFMLVYSGAKFFDRQQALKSYFLSSIIYPFFSTAVAFLSLFSGYEWKGRHFKK